MTGTTLSLTDAKARLSELARRVRDQHERIIVTRNGETQFVLLSVDDLEGLEITVEVLADEAAVGRIAESLRSLESGDPGSTRSGCRGTSPGRRTLSGPFAGCHGARRGTYRIMYRVDSERHVVHLLDIGHRSSMYRRL